MDNLYHGIYRGIVINTSDPKNLGRVTLKVPQITGEALSGWAYPILAGYTPASGESVWVMFEGGDPNYPLWTSAYGGAMGATGPSGSAATISVGSVTTGAAGSSASVTNSGSSAAAVFDFVIPQGAAGSISGVTVQTYTPIWTAQTTNPTYTQANLVGNYIQIGKFVAFTITLTSSWLASVSAAGSGQYYFSLPVQISSTNTNMFAGGTMYSSSVTEGPLIGDYKAVGNKLAMFYPNVPVSRVTKTAWTAADPGISGAGGYFRINGWYYAN
jgi:hypothetical protein